MKKALELEYGTTLAMSVIIKHTQLEVITEQLDKQFKKLGKGLQSQIFILDLREINDLFSFPLASLLEYFHQKHLKVVALKHHNEQFSQIGEQFDLPFQLDIHRSDSWSNSETTDEPKIKATPQPEPEIPAYPNEVIPSSSSHQSTFIVDRPVRSGQQVYAENADLIVTAMVSEGAEVIADGNIHVYAPLRGRALAGASGDINARIFTHCMRAQLVSIAGIYRTFDRQLAPALYDKAVCITLNTGKLVITAIEN